MYAKMFSGTTRIQKDSVLKTHSEHMNFDGFHGNRSWILKNAGVWGLLFNNLALMKNCQGKGVWACKVSKIVHVNLMKHNPKDLIYNFMLSNALLIHIYQF